MMITLDVTGWRKGLDVVALIKAVQLHSTGSLAKSKILVEDILAGKVITLEFQNEEAREKFRKEANALGAVCQGDVGTGFG